MSIWKERNFGVLFPISAIPSKEGIGTLGEEAYQLVDLLAKMGARVLQILPMVPTSSATGNSPYMSSSSVAGNPLYISIGELAKEGLLPYYVSQFEKGDESSVCGKVNYEEVTRTHMDLLKKSFDLMPNNLRMEVENFVKENEDWLPNYALFTALHQHFQKPLWEWSEDVRDRNESSLEKYRTELKDQILFVEYCQYLFFKQWTKFKAYAASKGVKILGDVPIYVSADSVEVWSAPEMFKLNKDKSPSKIAGVPPDYFSKDGQLWGNPVYKWEVHEATNYKWWKWRLRHASKMFDIIRIDHFRGLLQYWEIQKGEETARNGKWIDAPGIKFIQEIKRSLPNTDFVAEDLGIIGDDVREFVKNSGFPGMKVLIFGIDMWNDSEHLPHNSSNSVYYSSIHDSETFIQKLESLSAEERNFILEYLMVGKNEKPSLRMFQMLFCSPSPLVIIPFWDLLLLGQEGRFNIPGTVGSHNWTVALNHFEGLKSIVGQVHKLALLSKRI